jgi:hypothetical protein
MESLMLGLFEDLLIRMLVIVSVYDFLIWWILSRQSAGTMVLLFVMEMIVIALSLWFDVVYRRERFKLQS